MRAFKIIAYAGGALILLLLVALVSVLVFVDPNDYRDDIEELVEARTGRELTLSGLKLSIFPWLALELGPTQLGNAPSFGSEPFAEIASARISARFWPLLRGRIEVGQVALRGARVRLQTDASGRNNWSDLSSAEKTSASTQTATTWPTIAGVEIADAELSISNEQDKSRTLIRELSVTTTRIESGTPFDLDSRFVLQQAATTATVATTARMTADLSKSYFLLEEPQAEINITGEGWPAAGIPITFQAKKISADLERELHDIAALSLKAQWRGESLPRDGVPLTFTASAMQVDLKQQTLALPDLKLTLAEAVIAGALSGRSIVDAPALSGKLQLEPLSPRTWLRRIGVQLPVTRDAQVLQRLSFAADVALTANSAELKSLQLQLDETTATGLLAIQDFKSKALRFDLRVDRINADRYLPPAEETPAASTSRASAKNDEPVELPVELLRGLNARGQLTIGEAVFADMKFSQLRLGVNAADGMVRLQPMEASVYGGQFSGNVAVNAQSDEPQVTLQQQFTNVNFAPLFKDVFDTQRISGRGTASARLTAVGRNSTLMLRSLNGNVDFSVADGALQGADLWYEIRRARALWKREPIPERAPGPVRTAFKSLQGTGVVKNGVLQNNDLNAALEHLRVTGAGTVNLPQNTVDYRLTAAVLRLPREGAAASTQDLVDARIPVRVTGTLTDPTVRLDIQGLVKEHVQERFEQEKDKAEQKLKDKLQERLRGILGGKEQ